MGGALTTGRGRKNASFGLNPCGGQSSPLKSIRFTGLVGASFLLDLTLFEKVAVAAAVTSKTVLVA